MSRPAGVLELVDAPVRVGRTPHDRIELRLYSHGGLRVALELRPDVALDVAARMIEQARHAEAGT